ncbi:MAG: type II secretion system protein [Phycisphaerae bacterium]|nr:type II secretion system protein [Phycisphaerae bacterium]
MNEDARQDEILLIEFLTGRLEDAQAGHIRARLEQDETLRRRRDDLAAALGALDVFPRPEAPDDLAERTLAKIAAVRRTEALLAMQQLGPRRSTFSLKELLAVAAMLLVMIGVLAPSLHKARQRSNEGLCAMQLGQIGNALQTYAINHRGRLPAADGQAGRWLRHDDAPPVSNSSALFKLLRHRYLPSPVVFQCPSLGGASFAMKADLRDFPLPEHVSYSYQYSLGGWGVRGNDPAVAERTKDMAILADQTPMFAGGAFCPERIEAPVSDNHSDGQNVLYLDGHASWATCSTVGVEGDHIFLAGDECDYDGDEHPAGPADSFLLPAHPGK